MAPSMEYDPQSIFLVGIYKNRFVLPVRADEEDGEEYVVVHLTAKGNEALRDLPHRRSEGALEIPEL